METLFRFADDLGPAKIVHIHQPTIGLKAIVVIDNVARGPAVGGLRMAPDVSTQECVRLARAMTLKNAAAGLRHGGGKSVLVGDPKIPMEDKERLVRAFACALRNEPQYIVGPDMGTDERCMAYALDEIGRAVGLPREVGGIPLDEIGATGWGLCCAVEVAQDYCDVSLDGARVVIQGFGAVGMHTARFLTEKGALLVAASDSRGAIANPDGIDVAALIEIKKSGGSVADYSGGTPQDRDAVIETACDIWVPAARPDVITRSNAAKLNCKLIAQGANIPITREAEEWLHERGVLSIPDFIANAGGVICAAVEYEHGTEKIAFETIEEKIRYNTVQVLEGSKQRNITPRDAAIDLAMQRVTSAMSVRRWAIYS